MIMHGDSSPLFSASASVLGLASRSMINSFAAIDNDGVTDQVGFHVSNIEMYGHISKSISLSTLLRRYGQGENPPHSLNPLRLISRRGLARLKVYLTGVGLCCLKHCKYCVKYKYTNVVLNIPSVLTVSTILFSIHMCVTVNTLHKRRSRVDDAHIVAAIW